MEIGHVLFMDIVGYSKLLIDEQRELQHQLTEIVRNTPAFRQAEADGKLVRLPVGDGMALVFFNSPEAPVHCAVEIAKKLRGNSEFQLRMGINSGPINKVTDVNDRANIAGIGINIAQRVMDCADPGHILLSKRTAEDLSQSRPWRPFLHDLGQCSVKHGVAVSLVNLVTDEVGNPAVPEKVKNDQAISRQAAGPPRKIGRRTGLIGMAALVMILTGVAVLVLRGHTEKSIAVLPFENFSDDKENAFFADGIQDDILTSLAQIQGLRVISRTSVMGYRGGKSSHNLRSISKELGAANILEGSVRREGNRVAVTVQLIDAERERYLWANRYDRTLQDSLGLQGELAAEIADALRVTLTHDEQARFHTKPTENTQAYLIYLQANQIQRNPDTILADFKKADQLYRQVISIDPNFALAHARLASTAGQIYHFYEPLDVWKAKARAEAAAAIKLQPNLPDAHLALAQCAYWIDRDYDRALLELDTAAGLSPNNGDVGELTASIKRRQGRWQEALDAFERSQKVDPQNPNIVRNIVFTNTALRRWPEAARWAEKMRAMAPASLVAKIQSGYVDFWWKGDTRLLKSLVSEVPEGVDPDGSVSSVRWDVAMIDRDFATARAILEKSAVSEFSYTNEGMTPKSLLLGCVELASGNVAAAQESLNAARLYFENAVAEAPDNAPRHAILGWCYALAGRKDDAIREGRRAVELKPESKDAFDGAGMSAYLALIYALVGDADDAIPLVGRLLKVPGAVDSVDNSITVNDLKYRWEWDQLRKDPRFQNLIQQ